MKKIFDKLKQLAKTSLFKASIWSILITLLIFVPFFILAIILFMQYSYLTLGFWLTILILMIIFIVIIAFSNVIYTKLLNNYENKTLPKKEYLNIFVKALLGPFGVGLLIAGCIVFFDQLTKLIAINHLSEIESTVFIKNVLHWRLAYNKGAAWSMCSGHTDILAIISLIASFVIFYFMKDFNLKKKPLYSIAIVFILGGTIGNMIDRFFRMEGVVDFIELGFMDFPIFNLADSFLVVGTILLMISILFMDSLHLKKEKKVENQNEIAEQVGEKND